MSSPKVQMPTVFSPVVDQSGLNSRDWSAFFNIIQQIAYNSTRSGTTANRPTSAMNGRWTGMSYFDTTLNKPIWLKSVSPDVWVDATGTAV